MGQDKGILFFGLSTCPYCRRAKEYMENKNIAFELIYVDKLEGEEREKAIKDLRQYNLAMSFPTLVIFPADGGDARVFVGFTDEARAFVDEMAG